MGYYHSTPRARRLSARAGTSMLNTISMEDLFKDIDTPINVENAAIRHLSQVISELSPEQTQQLLQIVDSVMAIKNEYL